MSTPANVGPEALLICAATSWSKKIADGVRMRAVPKDLKIGQRSRISQTELLCISVNSRVAVQPQRIAQVGGRLRARHARGVNVWMLAQYVRDVGQISNC